MIFLPDQHTAGSMLRSDRNKTQMRAAVNRQGTVQTKSASQTLFHKKYRIRQKRIAERNVQILLLPVQPVQNFRANPLTERKNQRIL